MTDRYANHTCMNKHIYRSFYILRSLQEQNLRFSEAFYECLNYQSIIITNTKEIEGDSIFHYKGEFTHAMSEDGLAIREKIFSTIRNLIK